MADRGCKCLICSKEEDDQNPEIGTLKMEQLSEIFEVLCHYMDWNIKENCQLDFNVDPFPFCKSCMNPLLDLYKFHLEIQELLKGTQRIKWWMTSVLLDKFQLKRVVGEDSAGPAIEVEQMIKDEQRFLRVGRDLGLRGDIQVGKSHFPSLEDKLYYYQRTTYRRYMPSVSLSRNDLRNLSENQMGAAIVDCEVVVDYDGQEITDDACLKSDRDSVADLQESCSNSGSSGDNFVDESVSASQNNCPSGTKNVQSSLNADQFRAANALELLPDKSPEPKLQKTTLDFLGVNYSRNEDSYAPHASPLFAATQYTSRIQQIGENRFSFDKKLLFECVNDHEWKCLQCKFTTIERRRMPRHLSSVGLRCNAKRPKNAMKEYKYQYVYYDQLKNERFECRRCPTQTNTENDMKIHIGTSHRTRKYGNKGTNMNDLSIKHWMELFIQEGEEGTLTCESCQESFESREAASKHVSVKHKNSARKKKIVTKKIGENKYIIGEKYTFEFRERQFHCDGCNFQCMTLSTMRYHVQSEHFKLSKKVCEDCGKEFRLADSLRLHRFRVHPGPPTEQYECEDCGKEFPAKSRLNLHRQRYHAEKTFMCDICGSNFVTKKEMNSHKRSHVSATCTICGKVTTKLFIKSHMLTHSRKFECDECHKKFAYAGGLRTHKNSCGEQSKYSCDVCGMKFTQKHTVTRHKRRKHKEQQQMVATSGD